MCDVAARGYFLLQAVAVAGWWLMLAAVPASRPFFLPSSDLPSAFSAFALPDLFVLSLSSVVAALPGRPERARVWAWIAVGAVCYAALYTVAWAVATGAPAASPVLMVLAAVLSIHYARRVV